MSKSASYKQADCCRGVDCVLLDAYDDQPCWGQVTVVDEDYTEDDWWWVHACEGHAQHRDGVTYIPEGKDADLAQAPAPSRSQQVPGPVGSRRPVLVVVHAVGFGGFDGAPGSEPKAV